MLQRCLRYIRNFFGFTRGEARGFSVMALLLVLVYACWFAYSIMPAKPYKPVADQHQLDSLMHLLVLADSAAANPSIKGNRVAVPAKQELFFFNPNTVSQDSLQRLGFPEFLAKRLIKYREKGGQFRAREDLRKLYGMEEAFYLELAPWIKLPPQQQRKKVRVEAPAYTTEASEKRPAYQKPVLKKFDLNTADSLQLLAIRGIGPVLSGRILKFRNALGGFVQAAQVREVWGMPPETADALLEWAYVEADAPLVRLSINTADASELAKHPYISPRQAEKIVTYRLQHGKFEKKEDLLAIHSIDKPFVEKIGPYLQF